MCHGIVPKESFKKMRMEAESTLAYQVHVACCSSDILLRIQSPDNLSISTWLLCSLLILLFCTYAMLEYVQDSRLHHGAVFKGSLGYTCRAEDYAANFKFTQVCELVGLLLLLFVHCLFILTQDSTNIVVSDCCYGG